MINPRLILINKTDTDKTYDSVSVAAGNSTELKFSKIFDLIFSESLRSDIGLDLLSISNGVEELTQLSALNYLDSLKPKYVISRFERDDRNLRACSAQQSVDTETGEATIEFDVPITGSRTISGGEAWFFQTHQDDRITTLDVYTKNEIPEGILAPYPIPAGTVLAYYYDAETDPERWGFRIPYNRGVKIVETLAGYGTIPAGLTLRITAIKGGSAPFTGTFYVNIEWGTQDA